MVIPKSNEEMKGCVMPETDVTYEQICKQNEEENQEKPVGVLINPSALNLMSEDPNSQFFPLKPEDLPYKSRINPCGVVPECHQYTTYQTDYMYRGEDPRKCLKYEFSTKNEKCIINHCMGDGHLMKPPAYGRVKTDLKPAVIKPKPDVIPDGISEYMASVNTIGEKIIKWDIHGKAVRRRVQESRQIY